MHKSIGIAGTAKNTGKTTTTAFLAQSLRQEVTIALTSIGYDGEVIDTISGLPKPRLMAEPGDFIATAAGCLTASTAKLEVLSTTPCQTPLGQILIAKVQQKGLVVLVGPNKTSDLKIINQALAQAGSQINLIDGALNRLAPLVACDGLILATGASRSRDTSQLAAETNFIQRILSLPTVQVPKTDGLCLRNQANQILATANTTSLLSKAGVQTFLNLQQLASSTANPNQTAICQTSNESAKGKIFPAPTDQLYVPGILGLSALATLPPCNIVLENPLYLLLEDDLARLAKALTPWLEKDLIRIQNSIPLLAISVNPMYHAYDPDTGTYSMAEIDAQDLLAKVQQGCTRPVLNIVQDNGKALTKIVLEL